MDEATTGTRVPAADHGPVRVLTLKRPAPRWPWPDTGDFAEGIAAFGERRPAAFRGR